MAHFFALQRREGLILKKGSWCYLCSDCWHSNGHVCLLRSSPSTSCKSIRGPPPCVWMLWEVPRLRNSPPHLTLVFAPAVVAGCFPAPMLLLSSTHWMVPSMSFTCKSNATRGAAGHRAPTAIGGRTGTKVGDTIDLATTCAMASLLCEQQEGLCCEINPVPRRCFSFLGHLASAAVSHAFHTVHADAAATHCAGLSQVARFFFALLHGHMAIR